MEYSKVLVFHTRFYPLAIEKVVHILPQLVGHAYLYSTLNWLPQHYCIEQNPPMLRQELWDLCSFPKDTFMQGLDSRSNRPSTTSPTFSMSKRQEIPQSIRSGCMEIRLRPEASFKSRHKTAMIRTGLVQQSTSQYHPVLSEIASRLAYQCKRKAPTHDTILNHHGYYQYLESDLYPWY